MPVDVDAVIDAVAREMTEFEPSGALRARVLERIEQGRRRRASAVPRWAWAGAAAAIVAAVATAVWIARPAQGPGGADATVAEQRATAPEAPPAAQPHQPEAVVRPDARPAPAPRGTLQAAADSTRQRAGDLPETADLVPALSEIEPLKFSSVEPGALQIAAVEVAPLPAMTSIDIPSLDPGSNDIRSADPNKEK